MFYLKRRFIAYYTDDIESYGAVYIETLQINIGSRYDASYFTVSHSLIGLAELLVASCLYFHYD